MYCRYGRADSKICRKRNYKSHNKFGEKKRFRDMTLLHFKAPGIKRRLFKSPLDWKEIKPVNPKGNQP